MELNVLEFSLLVAGTSLLAGFMGSLTGLGGGVVLTPVASWTITNKENIWPTSQFTRTSISPKN